jgi:ribonuclease HII
MAHNHMIAGLDEAGRGALAGPIVGACVFLTKKQKDIFFSLPIIIRDSKKMNMNQRALVMMYLKKFRIVYYTTRIYVNSINKKGIQWANYKLFRRLLHKRSADLYIIDGTLKFKTIEKMPVKSIAHADSSIPEVILAGIVAKETRDAYMRKLHTKFPNYNWKSNAGYGTKYHIQSILSLGTTPHHRTQFTNTAITHYTKQ